MIGEDELEQLLAESGLADASAVVQECDGMRRSAGVRPDRPIYPASMIKVPIACVLARLFEAGAHDPHAEVVVSAADVTHNDAPSPFAAGSRATLRALGHAMVADSDNVATNALITTVDRATLTRGCAALGLPATAVRRKLSGALPLIDDPAATGRNAHPACDAAALLGLIARSGEPGLQWVARALAAQRWNDKLSLGWLPQDRFAHKTGDTDDVSHDGGILTLPSGRRFVVVVYAQLPANPQTSALFAAFARALRPRLEAPTGPASR